MPVINSCSRGQAQILGAEYSSTHTYGIGCCHTESNIHQVMYQKAVICVLHSPIWISEAD